MDPLFILINLANIRNRSAIPTLREAINRRDPRLGLLLTDIRRESGMSLLDFNETIYIALDPNPPGRVVVPNQPLPLFYQHFTVPFLEQSGEIRYLPSEDAYRAIKADKEILKLQNLENDLRPIINSPEMKAAIERLSTAAAFNLLLPVLLKGYDVKMDQLNESIGRVLEDKNAKLVPGYYSLSPRRLTFVDPSELELSASIVAPFHIRNETTLDADKRRSILVGAFELQNVIRIMVKHENNKDNILILENLIRQIEQTRILWRQNEALTWREMIELYSNIRQFAIIIYRLRYKQSIHFV